MPHKVRKTGMRQTASGTPAQALQVWQQASLNCQNHKLPLEVLTIELDGQPAVSMTLIGYVIDDSGNIAKVPRKAEACLEKLPEPS